MHAEKAKERVRAHELITIRTPPRRCALEKIGMTLSKVKIRGSIKFFKAQAFAIEGAYKTLADDTKDTRTLISFEKCF